MSVENRRLHHEQGWLGRLLSDHSLVVLQDAPFDGLERWSRFITVAGDHVEGNLRIEHGFR